MIIFLIGMLSISLKADIDSEIDAINKAPIEERFKLMNAFKKKIIKMQEQERIKAIKKLQSHITTDTNKTKSILKEHQTIQNTLQGQIENQVELHIENEAEEKNHAH